jgi:hypothetical protein
MDWDRFIFSRLKIKATHDLKMCSFSFPLRTMRNETTMMGHKRQKGSKLPF